MNSYGQKKYEAKYADTITETGLVGQLSKPHLDQDVLHAIKRKLLISLEIHDSKGVLVHGHQECAGNPVGDSQHKEEVTAAAVVIRSLVPPDVDVIPLFVVRQGDEWVVTEL